MNANKQKDGVSVREIEDFAKKHKFEVFLCLAFLFACFFSFVFFGAGWAVVAAAAGAVVGVLLPQKVEGIARKVYQFVFKQEQTTQFVFGVVLIVLAILLPPLVLLMIGLNGGRGIYQLASDAYSSQKK